MKSLSRVRPSATLWTAAYHAPPSMGFSRQEYWSGVPLPSPCSWAKKHENYQAMITCNHWHELFFSSSLHLDCHLGKQRKPQEWCEDPYWPRFWSCSHHMQCLLSELRAFKFKCQSEPQINSSHKATAWPNEFSLESRYWKFKKPHKANSPLKKLLEYATL